MAIVSLLTTDTLRTLYREASLKVLLLSKRSKSNCPQLSEDLMNVYLNIWQKEWRFKTASKTNDEMKKN